jgi:acetyl esterase/lipase
LLSLPALAGWAQPAAIPIWPGSAPGETAALAPERDATTERDALIAGRKVIRLGNVSQPTITVYKPAKEKDTGAAVVVFPGGGYSILAMDLEGTEVCDWLNSIGVTGVLLKYRVPARAGRPRWAAPLEDAQRAIGLVRQHAAEWGIRTERIGVLGFSAGGHLAAVASTNFDKRTYAPLDAADALSCRPDFTVLIYPAYLTVKEEGDKISPELKLGANTPPAFLAQAEDDPVRMENSLYYYAALKGARVPAELHLFPSGGHGYGLRPTEKLVTGWPALAEKWMRSLGMLAR